jgi:hypothetical protein
MVRAPSTPPASPTHRAPQSPTSDAVRAVLSGAASPRADGAGSPRHGRRWSGVNAADVAAVSAAHAGETAQRRLFPAELAGKSAPRHHRF